MGAHHADPHTSSPVGVRAAATAAAVVALTGAGAGIASAHDGADGGSDRGGHDHRSERSADTDRGGQDDCATGGVVDRLTDDPMEAVGLSPEAASGSCADPSSLGGLGSSGFDSTDGSPVGWSDDGPASTAAPNRTGPDGSQPADRGSQGQQSGQAAQGGQARPVSQARPAQPSSPIDTPPPPGQTRLIKLPSAR